MDTFWTKKKDYYKPVRIGKLYTNSRIEYKDNRDRNKFLSIKKYLAKIKLYSKEIINNLNKFDMKKIQLIKLIKNIILMIWNGKQ